METEAMVVEGDRMRLDELTKKRFSTFCFGLKTALSSDHDATRDLHL